MDKLRTPVFITALVVMALVVLIELGSTAYLGEFEPGQQDLPTPGLGIVYLALLDGLILFTVGLIGLSLLLPERIHGRLQGITTFFFSLVVLILAITMIFIAIGLLMLMVTLLMAAPFGTLAYLATYANFEVGAAQATLGSIMTLKIAFAVLLVLAHQRFLENKGLVLIVLSSLLANVVIAFTHAFPRFLVSITDDIGAIIVAILAAIWALVFLIGSIPAVIKALRIDRAVS
ncbi:MAG TPA: hypothetical protein ENN42_08875 [Thioalkalivibrio sp.]|nr:hypothetical protein [Thioalkalivibrio sp.]